jgi:long-chain acyl-CoA synthetase
MNRSIPLFDWAFSQGNKSAIVTDEATYSFADLRDAVLRAASTLADLIGVGTRVGLYIDSTPNFVVYQYAVFYLGGIVMPLNRAMREVEVRDIVEYLHLTIVISDTPLDLGDVKNYSVTGEFDAPGAAADVPPMATLDVDSPALLLQTSGSTGRPKGVLLTIRNLAANYDPTHRWIGLGKDDRLLLALPIFNTYGLNQGINLMAMTGATLRLVHRFSPETMQRALDDSRPTFVPLVPTMLSRLFRAGIVYDRPVILGIGAAASPDQVTSQAWSVFPQAFLFFGYGLTEGSAIASQNRVGTLADNNGDLTSVGVAVPGVTIKLAPSNEPDGRGEILLKGESVFSAYIGTDEPRPVADGWLHTGDIGRFDSGRLYVVDRKRDLIVRGGQNIYPGEIEHLLSSHEAILEAAVIGTPDDDLGEVPLAFVALRDDFSVTAGEIVAWMRPRAAAFKIPAAIHFVDTLPKTPTGKIRKLDLRELADRLRGGRDGLHGRPDTSPR